MRPAAVKAMRINSVIFDLDGTLVDSADGILASFAAAFEHCDRTPVQALGPHIIGPPLLPTLCLLAGTDEASVLDPLAAAFKAHYDSAGFRETRVYPGVDAMLKKLAPTQLQLYIATNKRQLPTGRIIDHLQWRPYFQAIYSLDSPRPALPSKGALIQHLLHAHGLPAAATLYVGDRDDDAVASAQAGTPFFHATWGYEGSQSAYALGGDITQLLSLLARKRSPGGFISMR